MLYLQEISGKRKDFTGARTASYKLFTLLLLPMLLSYDGAVEFLK